MFEYLGESGIASLCSESLFQITDGHILYLRTAENPKVSFVPRRREIFEKFTRSDPFPTLAL